MDNIDSKKEIEKKLRDALQSMDIKDLLNEEFIDIYIKDSYIKDKLKNMYLQDITLQAIDKGNKQEIEKLLILPQNTTNIKNYETLINKATEYIIVKRMKSLNIL